MAIITTHYRYKRPPRKRKAVALEAPAIVRKRGRAEAVVPPHTVEEPAPGNDNRPMAEPAPSWNEVGDRHRAEAGKQFGDAPDLTPEEHQRRGDAADALWRELVRRATGKPP